MEFKNKTIELRKVFFLIYNSINIAFDTCMLRNLNIFTFVVRKYLSRVINGVWMGNSIFSLEIKIDSVHDGSNLALFMNNKRPTMQLKFIFMANCMDKVGKLIIILIIHSFVETIRREIIYSFMNGGTTTRVLNCHYNKLIRRWFIIAIQVLFSHFIWLNSGQESARWEREKSF